MNKASSQVKVGNLDRNMQPHIVEACEINWIDPRKPPFRINGFAWLNEEKVYRRLPKHPLYEITEPVDFLADSTAGGQIRFRTNTRKLAIKVKLKGKANMFHMPATGQCGFDCYIGEPGEQVFCSVSKYEHTEDHYEVVLFEREEQSLLSITLHFPLYQGVNEVLVGIDTDANIAAPPDYMDEKKLIFYGTSILQGGCASRPGMAYTNIMSRRINREFINLGFSGNGKGEVNMAHIISEIENPACLVLDYEPNCVSTELYRETLPRFIQVYREKYPDTPILVVSKFPYAQEKINRQLLQERLERLDFQKQLIQKLQQEGDKHIYFCEGTNILGDLWQEKTVDGIHPTDLGFLSIADNLTPVVEKIMI
ncbi:SGNH/GDSL hydrolase family protein [Lederbergia citri]|uniref:SGNH/GDSL hydrolase family protein n=1 Tax=Lederbergia citri TaxID=2833580 RepID=A0A942YJG9_9BACI|nr:SGNH/GDSL hydrolase family protein [Lederbergia citri]MBS4197540.1 SGNH/GDSL hydrolase family protein [Lederbergia citri]